MTMVLLLGVILLCAVAALLEFACMRELGIPDNELSLIGRRILIAGWVLLVLRLTWIAAQGQGIHFVGLLALGCIAFGSVIRCANRLRLVERHPPTPPMFLRKGVPGDEA